MSLALDILTVLTVISNLADASLLDAPQQGAEVHLILWESKSAVGIDPHSMHGPLSKHSLAHS